MSTRVIHSDMLQAIPRLVAEGVVVDAIVCDPPYGLEFMGKEWDKLDGGLPQESVWKGRRGKGGSSIGDDDATPASRHHVGFGSNRAGFKRCTICGKRAFSGSPCRCETPAWVTEYPDGPPSSAVRMQRWHEQWARKAIQILRPGGFLLAFGGTRTQHRLVCGLEDAGFVIQDTIAWLYATGFPKNKAHLKPAYEPIVLAYKPGGKRTMQIDECRVGTGDDKGVWPITSRAKTIDVLGDFHGHSVTDKSLGRWPANIVTDGSDEVLAAFPNSISRPAVDAVNGKGSGSGELIQSGVYGAGRLSAARTGYVDSDGSAARFFKACPCSEEDEWNPSHASFAAACSSLLSEAAASVLKNAVGQSTLGVGLNFTGYRAQDTSATESELRNACDCVTALTQSIAQRFLRGLPLESTTITIGPVKCVATPERIDTMTITLKFWTSGGFAERVTFSITLPNMEAGEQGSANRFHFSAKAGNEDRFGSKHPTVKPVELMKWLVALVTPPGGLVLDPFAGSGTTGVAALATGRDAILIEREQTYFEDIKARLAHYEGVGAHSLAAKGRKASPERSGADGTPLFAVAASPAIQSGMAQEAAE